MEEQSQNTEIFKFLGELLKQEEFLTAQNDFFKLNCSQFSQEQEENKPEYQILHQEYEKILEQSIEAKLIEKYSEDSVTNFFTDFEENIEKYQDQETIQTLLTFMNFEVFKNKMIEVKSSENFDQKKLAEEQENNNNNIEFNQSPEVYQKYFNKPINEWKLVNKSKNEFKQLTYSLPFENTGSYIVRLDGFVPGVNVEKVLSKLRFLDVPRIKKKEPQIKEMQTFREKNPDDRYMFVKHKAPMISAREYLTYNRIIKKNENEYLYICVPAELEECPINKKCVRGELNQHWMITQEKDGVKVIAYENYDLKGSVPKTFMNMLIGTILKDRMKQFFLDCQDK